MSISQGSDGFFERTLWGTILKARQRDGQEGAAALERLLAHYRQPILRQIQASQRCSPERAEDLCHDFIEQGLRVDFLKRVSPAQGRFRTFIKVCIKNFLCDERARAATLKRGGGRPTLSLDEPAASGTPAKSLASGEASPDEVLDRRWALASRTGWRGQTVSIARARNLRGPCDLDQSLLDRGGRVRGLHAWSRFAPGVSDRHHGRGVAAFVA